MVVNGGGALQSSTVSNQGGETEGFGAVNGRGGETAQLG
jgi:hypothetical protein